MQNKGHKQERALYHVLGQNTVKKVYNKYHSDSVSPLHEGLVLSFKEYSQGVPAYLERLLRFSGFLRREKRNFKGAYTNIISLEDLQALKGQTSSYLAYLLKLSGFGKKEQSEIEHIVHSGILEKSKSDMALSGDFALSLSQRKGISQGVSVYLERLLRFSGFQRKEKRELTQVNQNVLMDTPLDKAVQTIFRQSAFRKIYTKTKENRGSLISEGQELQFSNGQTFSYLKYMLKLSGYGKKEQSALERVFHYNKAEENKSDAVFGRVLKRNVMREAHDKYDRLSDKYHTDSISSLYGDFALNLYQGKGISQGISAYLERLLRFSAFLRKEQRELKQGNQNVLIEAAQERAVQTIFRGSAFRKAYAKIEANRTSIISFSQDLQAFNSQASSYIKNILKLFRHGKKEQSALERVFRYNTAEESKSDAAFSRVLKRKVMREVHDKYDRLSDKYQTYNVSPLYGDFALSLYQGKGISQGISAYLEHLLRFSAFLRKEQRELKGANQNVLIEAPLDKAIQTIFRQYPFRKIYAKTKKNRSSIISEGQDLQLSNGQAFSYLKYMLKLSGYGKKEQSALERVFRYNTAEENKSDAAFSLTLKRKVTREVHDKYNFLMEATQDKAEQTILHEFTFGKKEQLTIERTFHSSIFKKSKSDMALYGNFALNLSQRKGISQGVSVYLEHLLRFSDFLRKEKRELTQVNQNVLIEADKDRAVQDIFRESVFRKAYERTEKNRISIISFSQDLQAFNSQASSYLENIVKLSGYRKKEQSALDRVFRFNTAEGNKSDAAFGRVRKRNVTREVHDKYNFLIKATQDKAEQTIIHESAFRKREQSVIERNFHSGILKKSKSDMALYGNFALNLSQRKGISQGVSVYLERLLRISGFLRKEKRELTQVNQNVLIEASLDKAVQTIFRQSAFRKIYAKTKENRRSLISESQDLKLSNGQTFSYLKYMLKLSGYGKKAQSALERVFRYNTAEENKSDATFGRVLKRNVMRGVHDKYNFLMEATQDKAEQTIIHESAFRKREQSATERNFHSGILKKSKSDMALYGDFTLSLSQRKGINQGVSVYLERLLRFSGFQWKVKRELTQIHQNVLMNAPLDKAVQTIFRQSAFRKIYTKTKENRSSLISEGQDLQLSNGETFSYLKYMLKLSGYGKKAQSALERVFHYNKAEENKSDAAFSRVLKRNVMREAHDKYDRLSDKYYTYSISSLYGDFALSLYQGKGISQGISAYLERLLRFSAFLRKEQRELKQENQNVLTKAAQERAVQTIFRGSAFRKVYAKTEENRTSIISFSQDLQAFNSQASSYIKNILKLSGYGKKEQSALERVFRYKTAEESKSDAALSRVLKRKVMREVHDKYDRLSDKYQTYNVSSLYGDFALSLYQEKGISQGISAYLERLLIFSTFLRKEQRELKRANQNILIEADKDNGVQTIFRQSAFRKAYAKTEENRTSIISFSQDLQVFNSQASSYLENIVKLSGYGKKAQSALERVFYLYTAEENKSDAALSRVLKRKVMREVHDKYDRLSDKYHTHNVSSLYGDFALSLSQRKGINQGISAYLERLLRFSAFLRKEQRELKQANQNVLIEADKDRAVPDIFRESVFRKAYAKTEKNRNSIISFSQDLKVFNNQSSSYLENIVKQFGYGKKEQLALERVFHFNTAEENKSDAALSRVLKRKVMREVHDKYDRLSDKYQTYNVSSLYGDFALSLYQEKGISQGISAYLEHLLRFSTFSKKEQRELKGASQNVLIEADKDREVQDIFRESIFRKTYAKTEENRNSIISVLQDLKVSNSQASSYLENIVKQSGYGKKAQSALERVFYLYTAEENKSDAAFSRVLKRNVMRGVRVKYDRLSDKYHTYSISALDGGFILSLYQRKGISQGVSDYMERLLKLSNLLRREKKNIESADKLSTIIENIRDKTVAFKRVYRKAEENKNSFISELEDLQILKAENIVKLFSSIKKEQPDVKSSYKGYEKKWSILINRASFKANKAMIQRIMNEKHMAQEEFAAASLVHKVVQLQNQKASGSDAPLKETIALLDELSGENAGHSLEYEESMQNMQKAIRYQTQETAVEQEMILMRDEIPKIVDMVYEKLEKRLKTERRRRGMV